MGRSLVATGRMAALGPSAISEMRKNIYIYFFTVQLTTSRIGNLTRLIRTLAICVTIHMVSTLDICDTGSII